MTDKQVPELLTTSTDVATKSASKYLQQMCKHFAHKAEVEFSSEAGHVDFPFGSCKLSADPDALSITCNTKSEPEMRKAQWVIASHLVRFGFREQLTIEWTEDDVPTEINVG